MKEQDMIYVVLVRAHTLLGQVARVFGGYEYTHIAVCLEKPFKDFITFSRRKHYNPFDCGFMRETLDCYAYGEHKSVKLKIFAIPVTPEERKRICDEVNRIEKDSSYQFNIYGMMTMGIVHGLPIYHTHNCMSFTGAILEQVGAVSLEREGYRYSIREFDELLSQSSFLYREGLVRKKTCFTKDYMEKVPLKKTVLDALKLFHQLNKRLRYQGKNSTRNCL